MYKLYATVNNSNQITEIKTSEFVKDLEYWEEIGEQESRHYHIPVVNEYGIPLYTLVDGKKIARKEADVNTETDSLLQQMSDNRKDITKADKILKSLALVVADLHNKTPSQMKTLIKNKYDSLG